MGRTSDAFSQPTILEFNETPLSDAIEFMADQHDANVILLDQHEKPITLNHRHWPLYLGLAEVARQANADWLFLKDTVIVGSVEQVDKFRDFSLRQSRLNMKRRQLNGPAIEALEEDTAFEFVEMPLNEILAVTQDMHGIMFSVSEDANIDREVTLAARGVLLSDGLDSY